MLNQKIQPHSITVLSGTVFVTMSLILPTVLLTEEIAVGQMSTLNFVTLANVKIQITMEKVHIFVKMYGLETDTVTK